MLAEAATVQLMCSTVAVSVCYIYLDGNSSLRQHLFKAFVKSHQSVDIRWTAPCFYTVQEHRDWSKSHLEISAVNNQQFCRGM